ncbi:MAG: hypothetical protein GXO92_05435 [FCB group bacterium]|nr:hypothetical protein [FCB group bacterium]
MIKAAPFMALLFLAGCATHPTITTERLKKGESTYGYTIAAENVFPYLWYRKAITDVSSVGLRLGLPLYGTGIDYSRVLYSKENKWDVLNLAWSLNPNKNLDFTYYKIRQRKPRKGGPMRTTWWGLRGMYIAHGIMGKTSTRIGLLLGGKPGKRFGYEIGYFHDFNAMPLGSVFDLKWRWDSEKNKARYGDTPHIDPASGLPSEYSRLTGISFQIFFVLGQKEIPAEGETPTDKP